MFFKRSFQARAGGVAPHAAQRFIAKTSCDGSACKPYACKPYPCKPYPVCSDDGRNATAFTFPRFRPRLDLCSSGCYGPVAACAAASEDAQAGTPRARDADGKRALTADE
jgi:hypothetical protein